MEGEGKLFLASQLMENRLIHNTSECNLSLSNHYILLINSSIHVLMKPAYDLDWCSMILMLKIDFGTEKLILIHGLFANEMIA